MINKRTCYLTAFLKVQSAFFLEEEISWPCVTLGDISIRVSRWSTIQHIQSDVLLSSSQANMIRKTTVLDVMRRLLQASKLKRLFHEACCVIFTNNSLSCRQRISWFSHMLGQKKLVRLNIYIDTEYYSGRSWSHSGDWTFCIYSFVFWNTPTCLCGLILGLSWSHAYNFEHSKVFYASNFHYDTFRCFL